MILLKKISDIIWKENELDFEAVRRDLFFKNEKGEMIKINDYQAICHDKKDQLLNIPKMQYTTLQLDSIKKVNSGG